MCRAFASQVRFIHSRVLLRFIVRFIMFGPLYVSILERNVHRNTEIQSKKFKSYQKKSWERHQGNGWMDGWMACIVHSKLI